MEKKNPSKNKNQVNRIKLQEDSWVLLSILYRESAITELSVLLQFIQIIIELLQMASHVTMSFIF